MTIEDVVDIPWSEGRLAYRERGMYTRSLASGKGVCSDI